MTTSSAISAIKIVTDNIDGNPGSLRSQIMTANNGDTIFINISGTHVINTDLVISGFSDLHIIGPYPAHCTITPNGTWSAGSSMIRIIGCQNVTFEKVGFFGGAAAIRGVEVQGCTGIVEFRDCVFEDFFSTSEGGAIRSDNSNLNVTNSSFISNQANIGGAIYFNVGELNSTNCTYSANDANDSGGVFFFDDAFTVDILHNTFAENTSTNDGTVLSIPSASSGSVNMQNNAGNGNGSFNQLQFFDPGGFIFSGGGNYFTLNGGADNIPWVGGTDVSSPGLNLLLNPLMTDGYGLQYYTISDSLSPLVDNGVTGGGLALPSNDCRRAPRLLTGLIGCCVSTPNLSPEPDPGAVEYTKLKVNSTSNNSGVVGSLPWAITMDYDFANYVEFELGGNVTISPSTVMVEQDNPTYIDGYSQENTNIPGPEQTGNAGVVPANIAIHINDQAGLSNGLVFTGASNNSRISGLRITNFTDYGVMVAATGISVRGCEIGLLDNNNIASNGIAGIGIFSSDVKIGGSQHAERNVISGNNSSNIDIAPGSSSSLIYGNIIGLGDNGQQGLSPGPIAGSSGIVCSSDSHIIGGQRINEGNVISGNDIHGILLLGSGNTVQHNHVGLGYDGSTDFPNQFGVTIDNNSVNNFIGGLNGKRTRNVISSNSDANIHVLSTMQLTIVGNYIGLDSSGLSIASFTPAGILINNINAGGIVIGGSSANSKNVISGNQNGIHVDLSGGPTSIIGNYIGTDYLGTNGLGNNKGILVDNGAVSTIIGGSNQGNLISGHSGLGEIGVHIQNTDSHFILGNWIGLDATGNTTLGNETGVFIDNSTSIIIGGDLFGGDANIVSGNTSNGIEVDNGSGDIIIIGNIVGADLTGYNPLGNSGNGIKIGEANPVIIGGTNNSDRNIISGNDGPSAVGIFMESSGGQTSLINNYIGTNIDGTGPLGNHIGIGVAGTHTASIGAISPNENYICANTIGVHSISSNVSMDGNYVGIGVLQTTTSMGNTDGIVVEGPSFAIGAGGSNFLNVVSNNLNDGMFINGDTSDNCTIDNVFFGTDGAGVAAGNGTNSLHIEDADFTSIGTIYENYFHASPRGIYVDGTSNSTNIRRNLIGDITGGASLANGIGILISGGPTNNTIGAPLLGSGNRIVGNTNEGILINNASFTTIQANYIGTDGAGAVVGNGIGISLVNADDNDIGGANSSGSAYNNIISNNVNEGILLDNASDNHIFGNFIGTDATGVGSAPNTNGISLTNGSSFNLIGDNSGNSSFTNVIAGNSNAGIIIDASDTNDVQFNYIGQAFDGNVYSSQPYGIWLQNGSTDNLIGGLHTTEGNIISSNTTTGIQIDNAAFNFVEGNDIGTGGGQAAGIRITGASSHDNEIGGTQLTLYGNEFIDNTTSGIEILNSAYDNIIQANFIGIRRSNTISGTPQANGVYIFSDAGDNNVIGTSSNSSRNIISNNTVGVRIEGADNQYVQNNLIGLDTAGLTGYGNWAGVYLLNGANLNYVGGTGANETNWISGNNIGVQIEGSGTNNNNVVGNNIGLNLAGSASIGNSIGVGIVDNASFNNIGETGSNGSNIIGGNINFGISINNAHSNDILNNDVGFTFPNNHGLFIDNGASNNVIGGFAAERNIISNNDSIGVMIMNGSNGNVLSSNYIGMESDGVTPAPNLLGVLLSAANSNFIGNPSAGENLISGNDFIGLAIENGANNNFVQHNLIGTDYTGNAVSGGSENATGIYIFNSTGNQIGGDWLNQQGNVICFNSTAGIWLDSASNNTITGNNIGLSKDNLSWLGNVQSGIRIENGSTDNTIGVSGNGYENVITDNPINIHISQSHSTTIENNFIGNDDLGGTGNPSGINNSEYGIIIDSAATFNEIVNLNVVAGNDMAGIAIVSSGTDSNYVQGNHIGVGLDGVLNYPNDSVNVFIGQGAKNNLIGGSSSERNIIAGNTIVDVFLHGQGTNLNTVSGNYIGVGSNNSTTYTTNIGIAVSDSSSNNDIGSGIGPDYGNYIPETSNHAIFFGVRATNNDVQGNVIGLFPVSFNNGSIGGAGVHIEGSDYNKIGGLAVGSDSANIITNAQVGVETILLTGPWNSSYGNAIIGNEIYNNAGLGIDQNGDGTVEPIDTIQWFGNNGDIDIPLILTAWNCGPNGHTHVGIETYTNTLPGYRVEVYSNINPDPTGHGEGETFLGSWPFNPDATPDTLQIDLGTTLSPGTIITATITGNLGNTSEFSYNDTVTVTPFYPVPTVVEELCLGSGDGEIQISAPGAHYFSLDSLTWTYGLHADTVSGLSPGTYPVYAEYLNGCVLQHNVTLNSGAPLDFNYTVVDDTCGMNVGSVVFDTTITNTNGGSGDYIYTINQGLTWQGNIDFNNLPTGSAFLVLQDTTLNCFSDTVSITIPEINDVVDESFVFPDFCPGNTAIPTSVATSGGTWTLNPPPSTGDPTFINSGTGELTNAMIDSTYSVEYTVGVCNETHVVAVQAASLDSAGFTYPNVCFGDVPNTTVGTSGGSFDLESGGNIDTLTGQIFDGPGVYSVIYYTNGTCPNSDTNSVNVLALPATPVIVSTQTQYCEGETLLALTASSGGSNPTYEWYDDAGLSNQVGTGNIFTPSSIGFGNNYFFLTEVDTNGCRSAADSVNYTHVDLSGLYASEDMTVCIGSNIQLEAFGGTLYNWDASDQIMDDLDIANPTATIITPESFVVTITDASGCTVVDTVNVDLLPLDSCHVDTYNAFSPNNDGVNDFWIIDGIEGYSENTVYVYNRWGDQMQKIENYDNVNAVWDGTNKNNRPVATGTYFFVIDVGSRENNSYGWVQVMK